MEKILAAEGIDYDAAACRLLARAADGSLRDALSLMDQAIAFGDDHVAEAPVREMLGTLDSGALLDLLDRLAAADGAGILERAGRLAEQQHDYAAALAEIAGYLFRIAVIQTIDSDPEEDMASERLRELAGRISAEDVQLYYQIALQGRRDLAMTPDPRIGFEMTLVRMLAFRPDEASAAQAGRSAGTAARPVQAKVPAQPAAAARSAGSTAAAGATADNTTAAADSGQPLTADNWAQILAGLDISGLARQLASHCVPKSHSDNKIELAIALPHAPLLETTQQERLQAALRQYYDTQLKLVISVEDHGRESPADALLREADERQREAVQAVEQDPVVQAMLETFDAEIDHNSIQPK
ncbi:MAG: DNA polymerase III subunit gamma/tau C-terminal domain-containing protein [Gammaproteobacteria bacterium]|nr:DNA polymerase III subunit gamma/tau C-terminal domain-containing protein [Gammaproteobacteria bacterium]